MRYYAGNKCCSGCGEPGYKKRRSTVDSLCYTCKIHLRKGRAQAEAEKVVKETKSGKYCLTFFNDLVGRYISPRDLNTGLTSLLFQIGEKFHDESQQTDGETVNIGESHTYRRCTGLTIPEEIANILFQIATVIKCMGDENYKEGKKDGINLLKQLNNGEITTGEFIKRTQ